jgi:glucan phosphoethanolaminetransferase (alkaline phosphatase superfamily)
MRSPVNYFYFGILCLLLLFLSLSNLFLKEDLGQSRLLYLVSSFGQALLEVGLLIWGGWMMQRFLPRFFWLYIGFTFVLLLLHVLDFCFDLMFDFSTWDAIRWYVIDETFENFSNLLEASGLPIWIWGLFFGAFTSIPLLGYLVYRITEWLAAKSPLHLRHDWMVQVLFCLPVALFLWDLSATKLFESESHANFVKALPWRTSFLHPRRLFISLPSSLKKPNTASALLEAVESYSGTLKARPNIYLIIAESLRSDFLSEQTAPHLTRFRKEELSFPLTVSNGNGTQLSWFSILHSDFPFYWNEPSRLGSAPLALLKKLGYQIRVYTSANLAYYQMDERIFGKNRELVDSFQYFPHAPPVEAWSSDEKTVDALLHDLENPSLQKGQLCILFWDATHFDYSFPHDGAPRFESIEQEVVAQIRSRYKNAIYYIDGLFHKLASSLPFYKEALIAFSGDHGEEFFDHGHMFHNSHLTDEQVMVPIYLKVPHGAYRPPIFSQMDILPTLFDALGIRSETILEGRSGLRVSDWPFALIARYNAGKTPFEFALLNGKMKLIARFSNKKNIFDSPFLQIVSLRSHGDEVLPLKRDEVEAVVEEQFGNAFPRLFEPAQSLSKER